MDLACSFKFVNSDLNHKLIALVKKAPIEHFIDKDGVVFYSSDEEETVENDLICPIRDQVFSSWQILTCPKDWIERYRSYMRQHTIPFSEEWSNNQLWFLIPRLHRPDGWSLNEEEPAAGPKQRRHKGAKT